jgi:hypothetical protein
MALSASFDFTANRDEIIEEALENIGVKSIGDSVDTDVHQSVVRTFQLMLKSLQEKGLILWSWREGQLPLVADTLSYTLGTGGTAIDVLLTTAIENPLEINDVRLRDSSGNERPCNIISLSEYNNYVNKAAEGKIVNVALHPGLSSSILHVWPVNDSTTDVLRFQYKRPIDDVDSDDNNIAFPVECMEAVTLQLTARLAGKFQLPLAERGYWETKAKQAWDDIDDTEKNTSFFVQPNFGGY